MSWLLWRQHRSQALLGSITLALLAIAVVITGVRMAHDYQDTLRNCPANGTCELVGRLFRGDGAIIDIVHLTIALPVLLGVFLGATFVARETEQATNVLVWTQTVTRRRWLGSKVTMALGATVAWSAAVAGLVTWWSGTFNALNRNRFSGAEFDIQNVVPVAHALFAVALGIAAGCVLRRTLPALAVTIGGYTAVRLVVSLYLRPHYASALTATSPVGAEEPLPTGSWTLHSSMVDPAGHVVGNKLDVPEACRTAIDRTGVQTCIDRLGYHDVVTYHPASRYWTFQGIESALFVAVASALTVFAILYTLRRDA